MQTAQHAGLVVDGKAPPDIPTLKPDWGKPAVRNFRGDGGNVGIIRSPLRASVLPGNLFGITGVYEVDMPGNISHCVYTATIGDALADVPAPGIINVTQRAGNVNGIYVQAFDPNGVRANHPFHLQVQC